MLYLRNTLTQSEERRLKTPTVTDPPSADILNLGSKEVCPRCGCEYCICAAIYSKEGKTE